MKPEKCYVYILQSKKDLSFYVGQTNDLDSRVSKHNDAMSRYTSSKIPWRLVYFEQHINRSAAIIREREIKKRKSKKFIQLIISNWRNNQ